MSKKIAIYITTLNSGGAENYLLRFLTNYHNKACFTVFFSGTKNDHLYKKFENLNIKIIYVKNLVTLNPFRLIQFSKNLKGFDVYCDFCGPISLFGTISSNLANIRKKIVFFRTSSIDDKLSFLQKFMYKISVTLLPYSTDIILSNSKSAFLNFYKKKYLESPSKYRVIKNGLDIKSFINTTENLRAQFNIPNNGFVVGNVSRFHNAKNHVTMINVAIQLSKKYDDFFFVFCGKGVPEKFGDLIEKHQLTNKIILLPYHDNVIKVYNTFDFFIFMSFYEGHPNALMEAMSLRLPFVASSIPSIKEITPPKLSHQLVEPDNVDKIISKIETYYLQRPKSQLKFDFLTNYIKDNYSHTVNFDEFYKVLTYNFNDLKI